MHGSLLVWLTKHIFCVWKPESQTVECHPINNPITLLHDCKES
jgi:hypothetical protein